MARAIGLGPPLTQLRPIFAFVCIYPLSLRILVCSTSSCYNALMDISKHKPPEPVPAKPANWLQELAYDIALEYHPPDELRAKYDLAQEDFDRVCNSVPVQRAVASYKRMIDEETTQARLKTKRLASTLIEEVGAIALDRTLDPAVRLRAIEDVCKYAELEKPSRQDDAAANTAPFMINIQVNT